MKTHPCAPVFLASLVLLGAPIGCQRPARVIPQEKLLLRSDRSIVIGERTINASVAGTAIIKRADEAAIISTETHRLTVERERVLLNGGEVVKLPEGAKKIDLTISDEGVLSVEADGVAVGSKALGK